MNHLKKTVVFFGLSVFFMFFLCSAGRAQGLKFGFKLMGGLNYQLLGDGNAALTGLETRTADYMKAWSGYTLERSVIPLMSHFGYEFDFDAILYFTSQFGMSLGTGFVRGGTLFGSGKQIVTTDSWKETWAYDVSGASVPIKIGVHYTFSSAFNSQGKSSSYIFGGIGLYTAKFSYSEQYTFESDWSNNSFEAKASNIGFYAGFGGESWINPKFAFVYEIYGRYAKVGGFTGTCENDFNGTTASGSGTVYYFERLDATIGNWYPWTWMFGAAPSEAGLRNVREAAIDFSGVGLRFGIKVNI